MIVLWNKIYIFCVSIFWIKHSRKDQIKLDCLKRPHHFKSFKSCLWQVLLGWLLNFLFHILIKLFYRNVILINIINVSRYVFNSADGLHPPSWLSLLWLLATPKKGRIQAPSPPPNRSSTHRNSHHKYFISL